MSNDISSESAFLVSLAPPGTDHDKEYDSIATGLVIKEDPTHPEGAWGTCAWFDAISANMRFVLVQEPPTIGKNNYSICDNLGKTFFFQLITKEVYDSLVKEGLLHDAPTFHTDQEVQEYILGLNPYENT
jgi:hypothetical protein